jgi:hypothetical protein
MAHCPDVLRQEHPGEPMPPMGRAETQPEVLPCKNFRAGLVARWILVCLHLAAGTVQAKIHSQTTTTKESVAWKKVKNQVDVETLDWKFISITQWWRG